MLLVLIYAIFFSPSAMQKKYFTKATNQKSIIKNLIQNDSRFKDIGFKISTDWQEPMLILGNLQSEKDLSDLKIIVNSTNSPVQIQYNIKIQP